MWHRHSTQPTGGCLPPFGSRRPAAVCALGTLHRAPSSPALGLLRTLQISRVPTSCSAAPTRTRASGLPRCGDQTPPPCLAISCGSPGQRALGDCQAARTCFLVLLHGSHASLAQHSGRAASGASAAGRPPPQVADFGLSRVIQHKQMSAHSVGTVTHMVRSG